MANPTTNFGWVMPTATDLVTDLPADFNVFGQGVDTSMQYLLGGTTGQVLSKTSGTNMAFTWINNDQGDITGVTAGTGITVTSPTGPVPTVAIDTTVTVDKTTAQTLTNKTLTSPALTTPTISTATTNGDLLYGTGSGALQRLGIGSSAQVLTVAAGIPSWATPASGLIPISSAAFTSVSSVSLATNTFTSTYKNYRLLITFDGGASPATLTARVRRSGTDDTAGNYYGGGSAVPYNAAATLVQPNGATSWPFAITNAGGTFPRCALSMDIFVPLGTNGKIAVQGITDFMGSLSLGLWNSANTAFDSLTFLLSSGNMTGYYQVFAYPN